MPFNGPVIPFGAMVEHHPISSKDQARLHQFGARKSCKVYFSVMHHTRGKSGKETFWSQTLKNWRRWTHPNSTPEGGQCKESVAAAKKWNLHIPSRRWNSQHLLGKTASENIHLKSGASGTKRRTRNSSRKIR